MKIKNDWERGLQNASVITLCVACVAALVLAYTGVISNAEASEGPLKAEYEQRIRELERSLSMYTNAEAVIVIRDDAECGLRWFHAGADLGCGTSWVRYRVPMAGGGKLVSERPSRRSSCKGSRICRARCEAAP